VSVCVLAPVFQCAAFGSLIASPQDLPLYSRAASDGLFVSGAGLALVTSLTVVTARGAFAV